MKTTFVNRGDQINVAGANALLLPFDPAVTDPQDATITLSDATSVGIGFDNPGFDDDLGGYLVDDMDDLSGLFDFLGRIGDD